MTPFIITEQPTTQNCQISNISAIDTTTIEISFDLVCEQTFAIRLQVTALASTLSITLNNNEKLNISTPGRYDFVTRLRSQENYNLVMSIIQDPIQPCKLVDAEGQVDNEDILVSLQCGAKFGTKLNAQALPWDKQTQVSWNDVGADYYVLHHAPNRLLNTNNAAQLNGLSINDVNSPTSVENLANNVLQFFVVEAVYPGFEPLIHKMSARPNEVSLDGRVDALTVAADGRVYVGGEFHSYSMHMSEFSGLSINATTAQDYVPVIAPYLDGGTVSAVVKDNRGGYIIGGNFISVDGVPRAGLARLHADGALDSNWQAGTFNGDITALVYDQGVLYVGGSFTTTIGVNNQPYLVALDADARLITSFSLNKPLPNGVTHFAHNGDELYIIGRSSTFPWSYYMSKISLSNRALLWTSRVFDSAISDIVYANNLVFVAGGAGPNNTLLNQNLNAFNPADGSLYSNFAPQIFNGQSPGIISALASDGGRLYIAGLFNFVNQAPRNGLAAFDLNNGFGLTAWAPAVNSFVNSLATGNDGRVYIGGEFDVVNNDSRIALAALDNTNGNVLAWDPGLVSIKDNSSSIRQMTIFDNLIFISGGSKFGFSKQPIEHLAAFEPDGMLANWRPRFTDNIGKRVNNRVSTLALDNDTIYIGGQFTEIEGERRTHLAAITQTGKLIDSFTPEIAATGSFASVNSMVQHNGEIYIAGRFDKISNATRLGLAALDFNGVPTDWNPSVEQSVYLLSADNNQLYVGGTFGKIDGQARHRLAAFDTTGSLLPDFELEDSVIRVDAMVAINNQLYVSYLKPVYPLNFEWVAALENNAKVVWELPINNQANRLAVDIDTLYAAGYFSIIDNEQRDGIAAITKTDPPNVLTWDPKLRAISESNIVNAIAFYGNAIYLGGEFETTTGVNHINLTAVDKTTGKSLDWPKFPSPW